MALLENVTFYNRNDSKNRNENLTAFCFKLNPIVYFSISYELHLLETETKNKWIKKCAISLILPMASIQRNNFFIWNFRS